MPQLLPIKLKNLFNNTSLPTFHSLLNLWSIEDGAVIGLDLQMSYIYEITPPDLLHKPDMEVESFFQLIRNAFHSVPENITIQFVVQSRENVSSIIEQYKETIQSQPSGTGSQEQNNEQHEVDLIREAIVSDKINHLKNSYLHNKRYYLYLTTYPANTDLMKLSINPLHIVNKDFRPITSEMHEERINQLKSISLTLTSELKSSGIKIRQLDEQETANLLYGYLNPSRSDFLSIQDIEPSQTLRSQLCYNACKIDFDHITLDGKYFRSVNLAARPSTAHYISLTEMTEALTGDYDMVFTVSVPGQEQTTKQLQMTATQSKIISGINTFKKYYEADLKAEQAEEMIETAKSTFQKFYEYSLCIILRDDSLESLTTRSNTAVQSFRLLGESEGIIDDMNHLFLWLTALPNHSHLNMRKQTHLTDAIAQLVPLSAPWKGCKEPKIIFQTDDGGLLPLDIFDPTLPAKHGLVLGTTGSGKSFATNYLLTNFFIESADNHIVIIDVGGSYRKFTHLFKGQYLEIDMSKEFAFNPFPPLKEHRISGDTITHKQSGVDTESAGTVHATQRAVRSVDIDPDTMAYLSLLVQKMVTRETKLSGRELNIIENAITHTYKYTKDNPPILENLHYQLINYNGDAEDQETARGYGKNLEHWTKGRYSNILNQKDSITIDSRLVVFDLQKLSDEHELQSIIFFIIRSVIESKLKNKNLKKMIVIDEGWKFFSDEVGSKLIQNLYRTARKFNAMILSISQSPEDFLLTQAATAIISNSFVKYVLKLQKGYELLPQFQLTEPEIEEVRNLNAVKGKYSEVFLKFSNNCRVIRIEPSALDYQICTTDPDDLKKETQYRQEHPKASDLEVMKGLAEETVSSKNV